MMTSTAHKRVYSGSMRLTNEIGLHARPSVKLTQLAKSFVASVEFSLDPRGPWTDAKSPVKVMRLKAAKGKMLHFRTVGSDAEAALKAILVLIENKFDER